VKLVHHDAVDVRSLTFAEREVGQNFGSAADYRRIAIDGCITSHHPHALGAEHSTQVEKLFAHECLDRRRIERAFPERDRTKMRGQRDQRLPRSRRRVEDHVVPDEELHDRFFLRGVEL
jgi:hypothetical protein